MTLKKLFSCDYLSKAFKGVESSYSAETFDAIYGHINKLCLELSTGLWAGSVLI